MEGKSTRDQLVLAAYNRLARDGFEGLRTRDVASDAGVNIATLHYYFKTKEDLIGGVVGHAMQRFGEALGGDGPPTSQLKAHFAVLRKLIRKEPQLMSVMGELGARSARDPAIAAIMRRANAAWHQWLTRLLAGVFAESGRKEDPAAAASLVMAALHGSLMLPAEAQAKGQIEQSIAALEAYLII